MLDKLSLDVASLLKNAYSIYKCNEKLILSLFVFLTATEMGVRKQDCKNHKIIKKHHEKKKV